MLLPLKDYMAFFSLADYLGPKDVVQGGLAVRFAVERRQKTMAVVGWAFCVVKFSSSIREVNVAQFVGLYALPLVAVAYLHSRRFCSDDT